MERSSSRKLHVFAGSFASREEACLYTEEQWEPEPDESASDDEYAVWEDRNPIWGFGDDLAVGLDSNFIETIDGKTRYEYLNGYLVNEGDLELIQNAAGDSNVFVLVFPNALHDPRSELASTPQLIYCGSFEFRK